VRPHAILRVKIRSHTSVARYAERGVWLGPAVRQVTLDLDLNRLGDGDVDQQVRTRVVGVNGDWRGLRAVAQGAPACQASGPEPSIPTLTARDGDEGE
jgi:hypothetical protein